MQHAWAYLNEKLASVDRPEEGSEFDDDGTLIGHTWQILRAIYEV